MNKKTVIWALFLLGIPFLLMYQTFAESKDCDQLVIDTYEIYSDIDIPDVDFVNCYYHKELDIRISVYDLHDLIDISSFELLTNAAPVELLKGGHLLTDAERPSGANLYLASGEKWGRKWTYVVDATSRRLWAEVVY